MELMVVVLIIATLLAVGIPTLMGARVRAQDRAVQAALRVGETTQRTVYVDQQKFIESSATLSGVETSIAFVDNMATLTPGPKHVFADVTTTSQVDDTVTMGAKSMSGTCFWMRVIATAGATQYGTSDCSGAVSYSDDW